VQPCLDNELCSCCRLKGKLSQLVTLLRMYHHKVWGWSHSNLQRTLSMFLAA
jgi:hypothetical protein